MRSTARKKWLVLSIICGACVLAVIATPRVLRAIAYQRKITAPTVSRKLAIKLEQSVPETPRNVETVDTHYSTFQVPAGVFTQLQSHDTWLVLDGQSGVEVLLTEIGYPTELSPDGNFTFYEEAIQIQPATQWQVLTMPEPEFAAHLALVIGKAATPYADTKVAYFETPTAKGFIRYGSQQSFPDVTNIAVWDKERELSQEITVTIPDPILRQQVANSIVATYEFKLDQIPDRRTLLSLVKKAAEAYRPRAG